MHAAADSLEFAPPPQPGLMRGLLLALAAHLLLLLALTWGLRWKSDSHDLAAEAELWSSVPQQAAPKEVVAPPPPPQPVVREQPKPEPPKPREADIALEREKQRKLKEAEERREAEERKEQQRKKLEAQRKQEELKKQQQEKLAAEEKKRKEKLEEQRVAKLREENLRRMQGLAGGSGNPDARGSAAQSSGPSASWAGRVRARVKPNIVYTDAAPGNPEAIVRVRLAPDGTIVSKNLVKSSGIRAWDDAVLRALDKTEVLPRDVDGRVPSGGDLVFRPKD